MTVPIRFLVLVIVAGLASGLRPFAVYAQRAPNGHIYVITRSDEEVIPGAKVVVTDSANRTLHSGLTNDDGVYRITLKPGSYTLEAQMSGFKKHRRPGIVVKPGMIAKVSIDLEAGKTTETAVDATVPPTLYEKAVDPPPTRRNQPTLVAQTGYSGGVTSVVFSPDGRLVLGGSQDKTARLWEAATGREIRRFGPHEGNVVAVGFSVDGRLILTQCELCQKETSIWDVATGKELHHFMKGEKSSGHLLLKEEKPTLTIVRASATAKELFRFEERPLNKRFELRIDDSVDALAKRNEVVLKDSSTGREVRFQGHSQSFTAHALSDDGRFLVTGTYERTIQIWDATTGKELKRLENLPRQVEFITFSNDNRFVLAASSSVFERETLSILDLTGNEIQRFQGTTSRDGQMFLQPKVQRRILILKDQNTSKELGRFEMNLEDRAFSPDGRYELKAGKFGDGQDEIGLLIDLSTGKPVVRFKGHTDNINSVAFSPDGRFVLTASGEESPQDNTIRLWDVATGQEVRRFEGKSNVMLGVSFSPNGRFLTTRSATFGAALGQDGIAGGILHSTQLWDLTTGQRVQNVGQDPLEIASAAYSSDGSFVLIGGWESARLLSVETGQEVQRYVGYSGAVRAVALSSDNRLVVTGGTDGTVRLWDATSGEQLHRLVGHSDIITTVEFTADNQYVVTESADYFVRVWEVNTGKEKKQFPDHHLIALSRQGQLLLYHRSVGPFLWDVTTDKERPWPEAKGFSVASAAFSSDGRFLLAGCTDYKAPFEYKVRIFNVETGAELKQFSGHTAPIRAVAFSADGRQFLSASGNFWDDLDPTIRLWDVKTEQEIKRFGDSSIPAFSVAFSPDARLVFARSMKAEVGARGGPFGKSIVQVWEAKTANEAAKPKEVRRFGELVAGNPDSFSSDGYLVLVSSGQTTRLLESATGLELRSFPGNSGVFSPDDKTVATVGKDTTIIVSDQVTGNEIRRFGLEESPPKEDSEEEVSDVISRLVFSPDGRLIARGVGSSISVWEVATGKKLPDLPRLGGSITSLAFSPDGRFLVSSVEGDPDTSGRRWDVATGKEMQRFEIDDDNDYDDDVSSIALSPDGRYGLTWGFTSGIDQMIFHNQETPRVWDATTEKDQELQRLVGHTADVISGAFSPDGRLIATASRDGSVRLWETSTGKELCLLMSFRDGNWIVMDSEGHFDTNNLEEIQGLNWVFPDDLLTPLAPEILMRDYYEPRLLARILAGERFKPVRSLSTLNRNQPQVKITDIKMQPDAKDLISVTVEVTESKGRLGKRVLNTGVYDLRLFRDGQLVGYAPKGGGRVTAKRGTNKAVITFTDIKLPRRKNLTSIELSAYAFNNDRVKSATDRKVFRIPAAQAVKGRAYLITVGIDANENPDWNLLYAANDARNIQSTLSETLRQTGEYEEIVNIPLISDLEGRNDAVNIQPTKSNFRTVIDLLAHGSVEPERLKEIPQQITAKLRRAGPEDLVLISFSGHGHADQRDGTFYLFPYDLGPGRGRDITPQLLSHTISSEELSLWLRDMDAGELVMIIDACHSAAAVEREGFKPGPMGSRGLGQLSYDKGMRILAATQADNEAVGSGQLRHGLLMYALVHDGIQLGKADAMPEDRHITLSEWLRYGRDRVPGLFTENVAVNRNRIQQPALFDFARKRPDPILVKR